MRARDPDDPTQGKAWAAGIGVALSIVSLGLLAWMALDVDNDGRSSYSEFQSGTSPMRGDTDGDGVADGWEMDHGYDALSSISVPFQEETAPSTPNGSTTEETEQTLRECSIDTLVAGCEEPGTGDESEGDAEGATAPSEGSEPPPEGGNGLAATSALGVTTTVLASVAGRVVAVRVLHS